MQVYGKLKACNHCINGNYWFEKIGHLMDWFSFFFVFHALLAEKWFDSLMLIGFISFATAYKCDGLQNYLNRYLGMSRNMIARFEGLSPDYLYLRPRINWWSLELISRGLILDLYKQKIVLSVDSFEQTDLFLKSHEHTFS